MAITELTVERLFLTGPDGERRVSITTRPEGNTEFILFDGKGSARLTLGVAKDGASAISIKSIKDQKSVLVFDDGKNGPNIALCDSEGNSRLNLSVAPNNTPQLFFSDHERKLKMALSVTNEGLPSLSMIGHERVARIDLGFLKRDTPAL
jgi:hypothetical protein